LGLAQGDSTAIAAGLVVDGITLPVCEVILEAIPALPLSNDCYLTRLLSVKAQAEGGLALNEIILRGTISMGLLLILRVTWQ